MLPLPFLVRSRLFALCAALVLVLCAAAAPARADYVGRVYLMRGLANVFSYGMDDLAKKLNEKGIEAQVYEYGAWQSLADDAVAWSKANRRAPVVIAGHSLGADAAINMAERMTAEGVPPRLVFTFDPVGVTTIGAARGRFINFYQENNGFGKALTPTAGFKGKLDNRNLAGVPGLDHFNIDKSDALHAEVVKAVAALTYVAPRPKTPAPRDVPDDAPMVRAPAGSQPTAAPAPATQPERKETAGKDVGSKVVGSKDVGSKDAALKDAALKPVISRDLVSAPEPLPPPVTAAVQSAPEPASSQSAPAADTPAAVSAAPPAAAEVAVLPSAPAPAPVTTAPLERAPLAPIQTAAPPSAPVLIPSHARVDAAPAANAPLEIQPLRGEPAVTAAALPDLPQPAAEPSFDELALEALVREATQADEITATVVVPAATGSVAARQEPMVVTAPGAGSGTAIMEPLADPASSAR